MDNDTNSTSCATSVSPPVKPDLIKRIGSTTFDIHIYFSKTSRETFTDKVVRLIENDSETIAD